MKAPLFYITLWNGLLAAESLRAGSRFGPVRDFGKLDCDLLTPDLTPQARGDGEGVNPMAAAATQSGRKGGGRRDHDLDRSHYRLEMYPAGFDAATRSTWPTGTGEGDQVIGPGPPA